MLCKSEPDVMFDPERVAEAVELCSHCPLAQVCRTDAQLRKEEYGVWGGWVAPGTGVEVKQLELARAGAKAKASVEVEVEAMWKAGATTTKIMAELGVTRGVIQKIAIRHPRRSSGQRTRELVLKAAAEHPDWTKVRLCKELGLSRNCVSAILAPLSERTNTDYEERNGRVVDLFHAGWSYAQIAEVMGMTEAATSKVVQNYNRKHGVDPFEARYQAKQARKARKEAQQRRSDAA